MNNIFNAVTVRFIRVTMWLAIITSFLGCGGCWLNSQLNKANQQVAIASGEIAGENQAAQIDLAAARPFVQSQGLPPFNAATTELTTQAKDIATLNQQELAQQAAYEKQLRAEQLATAKLQSEIDTLQGRWYVVMGNAIARWKHYIIGVLVLAVVLKGLTVLPAPWGTIAGVASTVVWSILTVGLNLLEDAAAAIAGAIATKVTAPAVVK